MDFSELRSYVQADLYRYKGRIGFISLLKCLMKSPGFKYTFWLRLVCYCNNRKIERITVGLLLKVILRHYRYKFGFDIPFSTKIGKGFYLGHFGGVVINSKSIIGDNCNISHGVTLGQANRGNNKGFPIIGHNVYIGPGAKIVGAIKIGDNVAIGANCVVTKDIPDNSVVVGIPGKVISKKGSKDYINNIDY